MITKIKRQECLAKYTKFPLRWYDPSKEEMDDFYPQVHRSYILTLHSKSFSGHAKLLAKETTNIAKALTTNALIFLGETKTAWRYQSNDFKPVDVALQFLKDNRVGKKFAGALVVPLIMLPTFIKHLSWIVRCNASLPYFYFSDSEQNLIGTICKYGNLHIDTLNQQTDNLFNSIVAKSNLQYLIGQYCHERYSKTGAIKHRQIIL